VCDDVCSVQKTGTKNGKRECWKGHEMALVREKFFWKNVKVRDLNDGDEVRA
jgi:hypothetical protein